MRYSIPYIVYIIGFGIIPFVYTFIYFGVHLTVAFKGLSLVPLGEVIYNTFFFSFFTALFSSIIGLILAIAIDAIKKGSRILSLLIMLPYTIPFTSSALIWAISFYGSYGWFTYLLHINFDPLYFPSTALYAITLVSVWTSIPMSYLIIFSSLKSIPRYVRESAQIDGLSLSEYYFKIAVPMVGKAFWLSFLLQFILALGNFDLPFVLTSGGPGFSTTTLPLLVYYEIFQLGNFSGGSLVAAILSAFVTIPSILLLLLLKSKRSGLKPLPIKIPDKVFISLLVIVLAIFLFFLDFPVYWMFLVAFRSPLLDFRSPPLLLPTHLTGKYFIKSLFSSVPYMISSIIVAVTAAIITVLLSLPSAYEISRGKGRFLLPLSIYLYSLPSSSYIIPLFLFFSDVNLLNTWWALILSTPIFTATFAIWVFYNYFLGFPKAYDDAAEVFNIKRKLTRIIMPLSKNPIFSIFLLSFIFNWHLLFYPLVLTQTPYNFSFPPEGAQTITIFALLAIGNESVNWGLLASSALVAAFPVMIVTMISIDMMLRSEQGSGLKFI